MECAGIISTVGRSPVSIQKKKITEYMDEIGCPEHRLVYMRGADAYNLKKLLEGLSEIKPDIVIVYSLSGLTKSCPSFITVVTHIFDLGVRRIISVREMVRITRGEWRRASGLLAKIARMPRRMEEADTGILQDVLALLPLNEQEAMAIYNAIARKLDDRLRIKSVKSLLTAGYKLQAIEKLENMQNV